jgi:hypothetical protein
VINPVVDVGKGKLRTMLGRMNRGDELGIEKYRQNPYEA